MDKKIEKIRKKKRKRSKNKINKRIVLLICGCALLLGAVAGFFLYQNNLVYDVCHVEAGVNVSIGDFLKREDEDAYFTDDSEKIDTTVPGEYHLKIKTGFFVHDCTLYVEDTVAPVVEVWPVIIERGNVCEAYDFIKSIEDVTATKVSFVNEPDYNLEDSQKVVISVEDAGGNITTKEAEFTIYSVVTKLNVEVGSGVPDSSAFGSTSDIKIITDMSTIDFSKLGSYTVVVEANGKSYNVEMNIVDTVPPVFDVRDINAFANIRREPAEFVTGADDLTQITYSYESEPEFTMIGTQTITIVASDEGGNQSKKEAKLNLMEDKEPPRIVGASDINTYLGNSISYKANVKVEDNCAEGLSLSVDTSAVNTGAAGTYPVTYIATDAAGNSTSVTVQLTIKELIYSEEEVNNLADAVLSKIINDNMTQYDKALAIFNYVKNSMYYVDSSDKDSWVKAAYEGLVNKRGDCFVYASTSKVLLTRAGIPNMDIERIPSGTTLHYWNLVDIGDGHGWYHFDTTPRISERPNIFLWTEEQLMAYSKRNYNSHNYDHSRYPEVK